MKKTLLSLDLVFCIILELELSSLNFFPAEYLNPRDVVRLYAWVLSLNQLELYGCYLPIFKKEKKKDEQMFHTCGVWQKEIALNQNQETDFALVREARTADETQSGLTLRKSRSWDLFIKCLSTIKVSCCGRNVRTRCLCSIRRTKGKGIPLLTVTGLFFPHNVSQKAFVMLYTPLLNSVASFFRWDFVSVKFIMYHFQLNRSENDHIVWVYASSFCVRV